MYLILLMNAITVRVNDIVAMARAFAYRFSRTVIHIIGYTV
jgi:hypothetical protein